MVRPFNSKNKFTYPQVDHLNTCRSGKLYINKVIPVLPGDTWKVRHAALVRLQAMISPAYGRVTCRLYDFFVPTRLLMPEWYEGFLIPKENEDGTYSTSALPTIKAPSEGGWQLGSLADSLGYPTGVPNAEVLAFKFRAYAKVVNDWFVNTALEDPLPLSTENGLDTTTNTNLFNVNYKRDYFTGCLPWRQRGPQVYLPLGVSAPVNISANGSWAFTPNGSSHNNIMTTGSSNANMTVSLNTTSNAPIGTATEQGGPGTANVWNGKTLGYYSGLQATADLSQATSAEISDVRTAFQIKKKYEIDARGGSRAVEYLMAHWNTRCSDGRLQRSEFLGGSKTHFMISEVLQTSATDATSPQGNMAGHGYAVGGSKGYVKTFEEHGYIVSVFSIIPQSMYMQGMPREDMKRTPEEFALPVLSHLSEDAVYKGELYYTGTDTDKEPFGFRPIYDDYRHMYSYVSGQFKSSLDFWTFARKFANQPVLNKDFIQVEEINRPFAVENQDNYLVNITSNFKAYRRLPKQGLPGLIDHS